MPSWLNIGLHKVGGIYFWNVGRIGGSFYVTSRSTFARREYMRAAAELDCAIEQALNAAFEFDFA